MIEIQMKFYFHNFQMNKAQNFKACLLILALIASLTCDETNIFISSSVQSDIKAVPANANALYVIGSNDNKVYRYNYTKQMNFSPTSFSPGHADDISCLGISPSERYAATGGKDYAIIVTQAFTGTQMCKFYHHNEVKTVVFDPTDDNILYSGAVDDSLRKWAIDNCSEVASLDVGQSIQRVGVSPNGSEIVYGTLDGKVGRTDSAFSSFTTSTAHEFSVIDVNFMNSEYYLTAAQDALLILWRAGTQITTYPFASDSRLLNCDVFKRFEYNQSAQAMTCFDQSKRLKTFKITNSSIILYSSHGVARSSVRWLVAKHLDGVEMFWTISYSNVFYNHLIYDDNDNECTPHYAIQRTEGTCKFCFYMMDMCHFCDDDETCTTCSVGTYRIGGTCFKCPDGCTYCNSATSCSKCATGYELKSGSCTLQAADGCIQYQSNNGKCNYAANGYYLRLSRARSCSSANTNCLICTQSSGNCEACETGYYVNSNSCSSCSTTMPGCQACSNSTICIHCAVAFKYNGANLQCSDCDSSCQTCGEFYDECLSCYSAQNRQLDGTSCNCMDGYYDISPTTSTCLSCGTVLTECFKCQNATVCAECNPHYYLFTSGGVTECESCPQTCETCSITSSNCTSCNQITYNRVLSGTSCVCDSGFIEISGGVPCIDCQVLNIGCISCSNETYCNTCDTGYYMKVTNASHQLCEACPYFCPDCSGNATNDYVCDSCPASTFRTLVNGRCECDTGYFDDNQTTVCEKCQDIISGCQDCEDRRACTTCSAGLYTDASNSLCTTCKSTCLTCGTYYDVCASCDPSSNRILQNGSCVCDENSYEDYATFSCISCSSAIENCASCESTSACTGCNAGYTLTEDLQTCIDCSKEINGCLDCTSTTNCTDCVSPFQLINGICRCPNSKFTSKDNWGTCQDYLISGLSSRLDMQWEVHQHQNNSLTAFIRFRAKQLYVLNQEVEDSIKLYINDVQKPIVFDRIDNNKIEIRTEVTQEMYSPSVKVKFSSEVFYNELLLTLSEHTYETVPRRVYFYDDATITEKTAMKEVLTTIFYVMKWIFLVFTIIGLGHYLFQIVVFIQIIPIFLMLNMALPSNLSCLLQGMISFQIKNIIPILELQSGFFVYFPHLTYDYYGLFDFFIICKLGDCLVIVLLNIITKFNEGFVRMFPSGKVRRFIYETLVRKGYSVFSLGLLSIQPSFLVLCAVYINWLQWENVGQIWNYISILLIFGFFLVYNFNHTTNLSTSKQIRNVDTDNCYLTLNPQCEKASKVILFTHLADFWLAGGLFILQTFPYFISSLILLLIKFFVHINSQLYRGKPHFATKTILNLTHIVIYVLFFIFYLGQSYFKLMIQESLTMGLTLTALILLMIFLTIAEKIMIIVLLKTAGGKNTNKIMNDDLSEDAKSKEHSVIFAQNADNIQQENHNETGFSNTFDSHFMEFFNKRPQPKKNNQNSPNCTKNNTPKKPNNINRKSEVQNDFGDTANSNFQSNGFGNTLSVGNNKSKGYGTSLDPNQFQDSPLNKAKKTKAANTSKYNNHHLQLRYQAQKTLTDNFD